MPPELAFLKDLTNIEGMDAEELIVHVRKQNHLIRQHAALIREYGMDPDHLTSMTEQALVALEEACREADEADARMFQAIADKADAEREVFKMLSKVVAKAYEEKPFDLEVQEWKEALDEWRKHMPKE